MQNYKKFMAQINERIEKRGKKTTSSDGGIMSRKQRNEPATDDHIDTIAAYIASIRKTTQRLKAKKNEA